jgi:PiT family inorganic phosphate transporter
MTLGTLIGGGRIIKKVGMDMVDLDAAGGTAADISSSAVLFGCSLLGIPVSTTHSKACAMMGVGSHSRGGGTDKKIIKEMLLAWLLTFPICASIGFLFGIIIS